MDQSKSLSSDGGESPPPPATTTTTTNDFNASSYSIKSNSSTSSRNRSIENRTDSILSADSYSSCSDNNNDKNDDDDDDDDDDEFFQQSNASLRSKSELYMEEASLEHSLDNHSKFVKRDKFTRELVDGGALLKNVGGRPGGFIQLEQPSDGEGEGIVASKLNDESVRELGGSFVSELGASVIDDEGYLVGGMNSDKAFETFDAASGGGSSAWHPREDIAKKATSEPTTVWKGPFRKKNKESGASWPVDLVDIGEDEDGDNAKREKQTSVATSKNTGNEAQNERTPKSKGGNSTLQGIFSSATSKDATKKHENNDENDSSCSSESSVDSKDMKDMFGYTSKEEDGEKGESKQQRRKSWPKLPFQMRENAETEENENASSSTKMKRRGSFDKLQAILNLNPIKDTKNANADADSKASGPQSPQSPPKTAEEILLSSKVLESSITELRKAAIESKRKAAANAKIRATEKKEVTREMEDALADAIRYAAAATATKDEESSDSSVMKLGLRMGRSSLLGSGSGGGGGKGYHFTLPGVAPGNKSTGSLSSGRGGGDGSNEGIAASSDAGSSKVGLFGRGRMSISKLLPGGGGKKGPLNRDISADHVESQPNADVPQHQHSASDVPPLTKVNEERNNGGHEFTSDTPEMNVKGAEDKSLDEKDEDTETEPKAATEEDDEFDGETLLLHAIFRKFCHPPPSLESVGLILQLERKRSNHTRHRRRRSSTSIPTTKKLPRREETASMLRKRESRRWSLDASGYLTRRISTKSILSNADSSRSMQSDEGSAYSGDRIIEENTTKGDKSAGASAAGPPRRSLSLGGDTNKAPSSPFSSKLSPPPSYQNQSIPLPLDALITVGRDEGLSVTRLLCFNPQQCLLALPAPFCMAFFRILIRILTNETDEEYDEECLFWYEDEYDSDEEEQGEDEENKRRNDNEAMHQSQDSLTFDAIDAGAKTGTEERCSSEGKGEESNMPFESPSRRAERRNLSFSFVENQTKRRALEALEMRTKWINDNMNFNFTNSQRLNISVTNRLYSIVRFRCSDGWEAAANDDSEKVRKSNFTKKGIVSAGLGAWDVGCAVSSLLRLFELLLYSRGSSDEGGVVSPHCDTKKLEKLFGPVARLLGLTCMAGVSVKSLRRILNLITSSCIPGKRITGGAPTDDSISSGHASQQSLYVPKIPIIARLHLIRALSSAAEGASQSTRLLKKASPRHFFVFGNGPGLVRTITQPSWPFKTDFGVACWFRAEHFEKRSDPILVSVRTEDGGGVEVSLDVFGSTAESDDDGNASIEGEGTWEEKNSANCATLVVSVYDSEDLTGGVSSHGTKIVRLQGCVLSSRVWYHIAVRHTRPRFKGFNFALSAKEEVSILLDGKVMLTEPLRFPKISSTSSAGHGTAGQTVSDTDSVTSVSTSSQPGGVEGLTANSPPPPRTARASVSSSVPPSITFSITFGSGFDGQTGALYVFKDHVSDEVLRSLFELTANVTSYSHLHDSMGDKTWDSQRGEMARIVNEVNAEMLPADAEEFVVSRQRGSVASIGGAAMAAAAAVLDLGEDEDFDDPNCPPELSRVSFGAKLFLVWDPSRTSGRVVLEAHSGSHVNMGSGYGSADIQPWCVEGAKDVIGSIGGVQALLPIFRVLLSGELEGGEQDCEDVNQVDDPFDEDEVHSLIPNLILLLASFLRGHSDNAREMLRCGGIDVVEQSLLQDKHSCETGLPAAKGGSSSNLLISRKRTMTSVIRTSPRMSRLLVDALVSLRRACAHNVALETKVFSRLLINMPLWLGKVTNTPGVALHAALLPTLSTAAKSTPNKVRACVSVKELIELVKEHTLVGNTSEETAKYEMEPLTEPFDRSPESGLSKDSPLTISERRHVIDVILGVVATVLISRTTPVHLSPLINFISFHLDIEWESANADKQNQSVTRVGSRKERYLTTCKACVIFLYLLQCRPQIPGLYESLEECLINADGAASWMLCCMVNSFDDMIRSLGIRCLTAFLDVAAPSSIASSNPNVAASDTTEEPSQAVDNQKITELAQSQTTVAKGASTITKTMKYVGTGLGVISSSNVLSNILVPSKANPKIIYKLLWHLLKCHRERLGDSSHAALVHLLVDDGSAVASSAKSNLLDKIVKPDNIFAGGFKFNNGWATIPIAEVGIDTSQNVRNTYAISTILRLMRFLSNDMKERWLFDLLALMRVSPPSVRAVLPSCDWQPCLFHIVSEIVEEINSNGDGSSTKVNDGEIDGVDRAEMNSIGGNAQINIEESKDRTETNAASEIGDPQLNAAPNQRPPVRTRFDLALKLYSTLLGHSVRQGGDKAFHAVEQAASLQRVCVNGHEVFSIVLSHLLAELIENGTVANIDSMMDINTKRGAARNKALKQSARIVTQSILSNGADGLDMASAVKQWRCLRHLTAVTVAVITTSGFGVSELFDYRNQNASAVDEISGGLHGIRLPEGAISGIAASDAMAGAGFNTHDSANSPERHRSERENYRRVCVILASQILSLLDAFIFPDTLDASQPTSQLHGLTLVRSTEPRLGQAQGPLLASLVRLSLLLLAHLEPSSVRFLQCCSRLRCFLHWTLELIRESVALGGYSAAFHELTAPLDRLVLAVVLQCHRAFSRCSAVLIEIESSPADKYFPSIDSRQKNYRRLFRATLELREIVLAAYRGRNEVLRAALSLQAYEALQAGLEEINNQKLQGLPKSHRRSSMTRSSGSRASGNRASASGGSSSKEASLRAFMANSWVTGFHDVDIDGNLVIPEQVANGQIYRHRTASNRGRLAIEELASESKTIINDYNRALNAPFEAYCEDQRQWAETDAVRDMEYEGDIAVKRLSAKYRSDLTQITRLASLRSEAAEHRWKLVERKINEPWMQNGHWKLAKHTDRLQRRILLVRNRKFDSHEEASYELMLGREREKAQKFREERLRKLKEKKEQDLSDSQHSNKNVVTFGDLNDEEKEGRQMTKVSSMVRVASKGIIPFAEYASDDNEDADDIDDITLEPDDAEESQLPDEDKEEELVSEQQNTDTADWDQVGPEDYEQYEEGELEQETDSNAWAKAFVWSEGEQLVHSFESVVLVTLQTIKEGILLLTTHGLYFHPTEDEINVMTKEKVSTTDDKEGREQKDRRWRLSRLTEVHGRRYMLRAQALELFFADSHELFVNFNAGTKERDKFYAKLRNSCKVPMLCSPKSLNPRTVFKRSNLTELWRKRKISNFDYLMHLNIMAGRTFNDITQYPVFPWILADYTSKELDLSDTRVFRDLTKPVGALNPDRLSQLIERYHNLDGFPEEERFLYGSHYSSPGVVLHYLIRQEPFTTMAIELQSGRFDCPDRLFFDVAGTWKSCLTSTSDVKELTPEFFTCPEIFLNTCNFPLGETQSGVPVNNVKLPPWANGSPYEFVRMHRLALESEYVSQNLSHWVDLIFGYKQRGPNAAAAHNVFHYLSYEGSVDLDKITDPLDRKATESHIQNFGQTPSQLIVKEPHPTRSTAEECWKPLCNEISCLKELRCHTPKKQFGGVQTLGAVISIHVLTESIVVIYSDLSVGTYKWSASRSGFSFKMDKLRIMGCRDASMSPSAVYGGSCAPERVAPKKSRPKENGTKNTANDGKSVVGHWSFGMTLGGSINDGLRRRAAMGTTRTSKPFEGSSSLTDASYLLLSCGYFDGTVKMHSIDGLRMKCSGSGGHRGAINCLRIGEDGGLMITGGQDATCRVWVVDHSDMASALTDGYVQTALGNHSGEGGDNLLSCCHVLWGHEEAITCLDFSSDLDVVISGSANGIVCIHSVRRGKFIRSIDMNESSFDRVLHNRLDLYTTVRLLTLHSSGSFATHLEDGMLLLYTVNGVKLSSTDAGEKLNSMKICTGGEMLVTGGESCHVVIRSMRDLGVLCVLDLSIHGPIRCITLTPSSLNPAPQYMYIGTDDGKVTIVDRGPLKRKPLAEDEDEVPYWNVK